MIGTLSGREAQKQIPIIWSCLLGGVASGPKRTRSWVLRIRLKLKIICCCVLTLTVQAIGFAPQRLFLNGEEKQYEVFTDRAVCRAGSLGSTCQYKEARVK